jgi:hypothetical protein
MKWIIVRQEEKGQQSSNHDNEAAQHLFGEANETHKKHLRWQVYVRM